MTPSKFWGVLTLALVGSAACSPEAGEGGNATTPAATATASGAAAAGGTQPGPAPSASGGAPGLFAGAGGNAPIDPEQVCDEIPVRPEIIEETVEIEVPIEIPYEVEVPVEIEIPVEIVEQVPTAIYVMLDRSTSMVGNLWQTAVSSLTAFVQDPASEGLQVALQYFPLDLMPPDDYGAFGIGLGPACVDPNGAPHNTPAVPMGLLPDNAGPIVNSLNTTVPAALALTPTEPALRGLVNHCAAFKQQNPGWACIAVLVTDGDPTICVQDINTIAGIAGTAKANNDITTFTVGMGQVNFNALNIIATQGQGDCDAATPGYQACNVSGGPNDFLDALKAIRETVRTETRTETRIETRTETRTEYRTEFQTQTTRTPLQCEFGIPEPPSGESFDSEKVNVDVTFASGATESLGKVANAAECASHDGGGWYYDDPMRPTRILICANTCARLEADELPTVNVLLGCLSRPAR